MYFDFAPFELSKEVCNLPDFLNYMDKIDGFGSFDEKLLLRIGHQVSNGLAYLHGKETAHRDLKANNILVSNQHYCHLSDQERTKIFAEEPKSLDLNRLRGVQIILISLIIFRSKIYGLSINSTF